MLCKVQKEPRFGDVVHQDKLNFEVLDVNAMQVHDGGGGCNQGRLCHILCRVCRLCGLKDAYRARAATGKVIKPPPPPKSANKSADRFFGKTGTQYPGSQSQAPNTPSLWLLSSWSHVETQNICQFSKNIFSSLGFYMVPEQPYGGAQRWSSGTCLVARTGKRGFKSQTDFLLHFFSTCLAEKIGFPCINKACWKTINAHRLHRLPICITLCAGWVCSTDLQSSLGLYMVPEQ